MHPSRLVRVITLTFTDGFQNYFDTAIVFEEEKCHLKHPGELIGW